MARPKKPKYELDFMVKQIDEYLEHINKAGLRPIVKECFLLNDWDEEYTYALVRNDETGKLSQSINKIVLHKEIFLERKLDDPNIKPAGIIFSLKQLGWKDVNGLSIEKTSGISDLVDSIEKAKDESKS